MIFDSQNSLKLTRCFVFVVVFFIFPKALRKIQLLKTVLKGQKRANNLLRRIATPAIQHAVYASDKARIILFTQVPVIEISPVV